MATTTLIPKGCVFLNPTCLVTQAAKDLYDNLDKKAENRCPDNFDMYIYNGELNIRVFTGYCLTFYFIDASDYFSYGVLDLIDKTLSTLHAKIIKKDYDTAYSILEALTLFMSDCGAWTGTCLFLISRKISAFTYVSDLVGSDDGERVQATSQAYGALLVNVLRGLEKKGRLNTTEFPSLESLLRNAVELGDEMEGQGCETSCHLVCQAIGWRLFHAKSPETIALEKKQVQEWLNSLDEEMQAEVKEMMEQDKEDDLTPWYQSGKDENENERYEDLAMVRVWKDYKDYLRECPTLPFRGPGEWDLTKWSHEEKRPFLFSEMDV